MIELPRRSVTRFFVPLIDVLILLFCIFLLLPFVSTPDSGKGAEPNPLERGEPLPKEVAELQRRLVEAERRIERLLKDRATPGERLSVRVLEIDGDSGKLFAFDPDSPELRQELRDQADAQRVIDRQRRLAGTKEPYFLILYPRKLTGYPLQRQIDTYRRWFRDVPVSFDNPWASPAP